MTYVNQTAKVLQLRPLALPNPFVGLIDAAFRIIAIGGHGTGAGPDSGELVAGVFFR